MARSPLSFFRGLFARARSAFIELPDYLRQLTSTWSLPKIKIQHGDAFSVVAAVNFSVSLIQDTVASIPLRFYTLGRSGEKVYIEPKPGNVAGLWAGANTEQTEYELVQDIVGSRQIYGVAYLFLDPLETSKVQQLWVLDPARVQVIRGQGRSIAGYKVANVDVPRDQIIRIARFDPKFGLEPVSPLDALVQQYESMHDANRLERTFYEKGGVSPGYFTTEQGMDEDHLERLEKQLEKRSSLKRAWSHVVLPKSLKFERAGLTMDEMRFIESHLKSLKDVLLVFKIPPMFAGISEGAGLNSDVARVAMMMMHQNVTEPECRAISSTLNERLLKSGAFGQGVRCEFDFSGVIALQMLWIEQAKAYTDASGGPVVKRSESRARLKLDEITDDPTVDQLLVPINMVTEDERAADVALPSPGEPPARSAHVSGQARFVAASHRSHNRDQLRVRADRSLRMHERRMERGFRRVFRRQEERTIANVRAQIEGRAFDRALDLNDLLRDDQYDESIIRAVMRAIIEDQGEAALAELGLDLLFNVNATDVRLWISENAARAITQTSETTRGKLRDSLSAGTEANEGLDQLIARVRDVFDGRRRNVQTIARTETAPAYNYATVTAWDDSGVVEGKEWLTSRDDEVRDAHQGADGQVARLDLSFDVGGEQLDFPGDPAGSPENIINCRCTVLPVVREESRRRDPLPPAIAARMNGNGKVHGTIEEWIHAGK